MKSTVLIVDDDPTICETVSKILEREGIEVLIAKSGEVCLKILEKGFQGLILMDIMMPGMDGWDTIQKLVNKHLTEGNIICMISGKENPDERMDTLKEFVLDYIRKPFTKDKLILTVKHYLSYLK